MTAHVRRPSGTSVEINRVAKISPFDLIDTQPDTLCELKRAVHTMDLLEVSDNAEWLIRVAAVPTQFRGMFATGQYDRLRYRHYVYGLDRAAQQRAMVAVLSASSLVATWYRLQASTAVSGEWASITDVLGGAPLTQVAAVRKPAEAASANSLPLMTFDGTDVLVVPLAVSGAGNNGTSKWWCRFRIKPVDFAATQTVLGFTSAAGTAPNKLSLTMLTGGAMMFTAFVSGFNGRNYNTPAASLTAGVWNTVYCVFDGARGNEFDSTGVLVDSRMRVRANGAYLALTAADTGTGGAVVALLAAAGTAAIGAANDVDSPVVPLRNGTQLDPNIQFGIVPLTDAELAVFEAFEVPT